MSDMWPPDVENVRKLECLLDSLLNAQEYRHERRQQ